MAGECFYSEEIARLRDSLFKGESSASAENFNNYFFQLIGKTLINGHNVLDLGTGNGYVLSELLNRFPELSLNLFGIDNSEAMVERARRLLDKRASINLGDNSNLPWQDNFFNLITAKNVTSTNFYEANRVLQRGGYFILREYGPAKGLVEVASLFPKERLIRSRSLDYYVSQLKENDFEIEIAEQYSINRTYTQNEIIEIVKSFPFILRFSIEDERKILDRFNSSLERITSDPLIIVARSIK